MSDIDHSWSPGDCFDAFSESNRVLPKPVTLGSVLIATIIKAAGYEVDFLDNYSNSLFEEKFIQKLQHKPHAICISTTFIMDIRRLEKLVGFARTYCPGAPVIIGGGGIIGNHQMSDLADFSIPGDGECAVVPLLDSIFNNSGAGEISGVYCRGSAKSIQSSIAFDADLDGTIWPDWSMVSRLPGEFYPLETQRGCRWRCTFCNFPARAGNTIRYRSLDSIISEIIRNFEKFGIYRYVFADSTFTSPADRCRELLQRISDLPFSVEWVAYGRIDTITFELAELMKKSGCLDIFLGLESGDDSVLRKMNKGFGIEKIRSGMKSLHQFGISSTASWLIGFPGETVDTVKRTQDFILEVRSPFNALHCFNWNDLAPMARMKEKLGIHVPDGSRDWTHDTMNYETAYDLYQETIELTVQNDLFITGGYSAGKYGTIGFSFEEIIGVTKIEHDLYKHRVKRNEEFARANEQLSKWVHRIKFGSMNHPLNLAANSSDVNNVHESGLLEASFEAM